MINQPMLDRPRDKLEGVKGLPFVRAIIARAIARDDDPETAMAYAASRWGAKSEPVTIIKSEIEALSTGSDLVGEEQGEATAEFIALAREKSVPGRLTGIRRRPSRTRIIEAQSGATAHWVGQGKAIPLSGQTFEQSFTRTLKCAALLVTSDELLRSLDPAAELGIRNDLVSAMSEAIDRSFLDPLNFGVTDEEPASITAGLDPIVTGGGADIDDLRAALVAAAANFGGDLNSAYVIARPELFVAINGMSYGGFGAKVGARGGELAGLPAIASRALPLDANGQQQLILVDPAGIIYTADDAATQVRVSRQASIEMLDGGLQGSAVADVGGASMVSMWQANCAAILAVAHQNWSIGRPGSVELLNGLQIASDLT